MLENHVISQQTPAPEKNKVQGIPSKCGLVAVETREFQLITHEKPVTVTISLANWDTLFGHIYQILTKWDTLSNTQDKLKPYKNVMSQLKTNFKSKLQTPLDALKTSTTAVSDKFGTQEKVISLSLEPFPLEYKTYSAAVTEMRTILTTNAHPVTITDLDMMTDLFKLFQGIDRPNQFLKSLIPDLLATLFALAADTDCPITAAEAFNWAAVIFETRLSADTLKFDFPCLSANKYFQEYELLAFPAIWEGKWSISKLANELFWLADSNKTMYQGNKNILRLYDDKLESIPLYTIDVQPKTAVDQFASSLFLQPYKHNDIACPAMEEFTTEVSSLLSIGSNNLLYFTNYEKESAHTVLNFLCDNKPSLQPVTQGLSFVTLDPDCILQFPVTTQLVEVSPIQEETPIIYIPEETGSVKIVVSKKDLELTHNKDGRTTITANQYLIYFMYALLIIGIIAIAKFNFTTIYKVGKKFMILYSYFRRHPVSNLSEQNNTAPPPAARHQVISPFII
jgi:hypothetical protein